MPKPKDVLDGSLKEEINASRRILIVDDAKNWISFFKAIASNAGVEVVLVSSSEAAKKSLQDGGFTEIITDGLEGDWVDVVEAAGDLLVTLVSGDSKHKKLAKKMRVPFISKGRMDRVEALFKG